MPKNPILYLKSIELTANLADEHPADKHERLSGHNVTTIKIRRRLGMMTVCYWSWHLCDDCKWEGHGYVDIVDEPAQLMLQLGGGQ